MSKIDAAKKKSYFMQEILIDLMRTKKTCFKCANRENLCELCTNQFLQEQQILKKAD